MTKRYYVYRWTEEMRRKHIAALGPRGEADARQDVPMRGEVVARDLTFNQAQAVADAVVEVPGWEVGWTLQRSGQ